MTSATTPKIAVAEGAEGGGSVTATTTPYKQGVGGGGSVTGSGVVAELEGIEGWTA